MDQFLVLQRNCKMTMSSKEKIFSYLNVTVNFLFHAVRKESLSYYSGANGTNHLRFGRDG
jgi:hypothetical protein